MGASVSRTSCCPGLPHPAYRRWGDRFSPPVHVGLIPSSSNSSFSPVCLDLEVVCKCDFKVYSMNLLCLLKHNMEVEKKIQKAKQNPDNDDDKKDLLMSVSSYSCHFFGLALCHSGLCIFFCLPSLATWRHVNLLKCLSRLLPSPPACSSHSSARLLRTNCTCLWLCCFCFLSFLYYTSPPVSAWSNLPSDWPSTVSYVWAPPSRGFIAPS